MRYVFSAIFLCLSIAFARPAQSGTFSNPPQFENDASSFVVEWNKESNAQAIDSYLETAERLKQSNPQQAAFYLLEAGRQTIVSGNRNQAEKLFKDALPLLNNSPNDGLRASLLSELALLSFESGRVSEAGRHIEKALILAEKSEDFSALGSVYYVEGLFRYFNDEEDKAVVFFQKSEDNYRKAGNPTAAVKSIIGLGYVYIVRSEFQKSLDLLNRALAECEQRGDRRGTAFIYKAIGSVHKQMYDYPKAVGYFQKAEQSFPDALDLDEKAMLYNWLGSLYEDYGNWRLSLNYRRKAYQSFSSSDHTYGQMTTLISVARLENLLGENAAALRDIEQADFFSGRIKNKFYAAAIAEEKSNIYLKQNDLAKAAAALRQALGLYDARLFQRQIARARNKLGEILEHQNRLAEAVENFNSSLALSRKVKDTLTESQTLYHLARLNDAAGKTAIALEFIKKSIHETESSGSNLFNAKLKSQYLSNVYERYELYIKILMKSRPQNVDAATLALQIAEMSRARMILENISLSESNFSKDATPEIVEKEKNLRQLLNSKADKLTDSLSANTNKAEISRLNNDILELEHELEEIKGILKQNSPIYSAIKNPATFDVGEFQRAVLDDDSMFLEFSFGDEASYLWLVGKNEFFVYVLPARQSLESLIEKLRASLAAREPRRDEAVEDYQTRTAAAEKDFERGARILSDALFGQIADKINSKRLIVVPDGRLHYFPISALPFPNSNDAQPILLTNEVVYAPSASTLLLLSKEAKQSDGETKNLLVFADPVFTGDDARILSAAQNADRKNSVLSAFGIFRSGESLSALPRLFASKDEADSIIEIVGSDDARLADGFAATREAVLDSEMSRYRVIHFATHGFLDEERPELSSLVLSRYDEQGRDRDGLIRLNDIYGLNLAADLVVLSACSTGIGKELKGEGLLSLDNAFLQVGAKSVVSSLWRVDDSVTGELMKNFYGEMTSGTVTTADALRRAQIKLRSNPRYQSAFYWAAFTVKGNFQSSPRFAAKRFGGWIYATAIFPVLLLGVYFYRRRLLNRKVV